MPRRRPDEPLPVDAETFWAVPSAPADDPIDTAFDAWLEPEFPDVPAALPRRLGAFPGWRGAEDLHLVLEDIYRKAADSASHLLEG